MSSSQLYRLCKIQHAFPVEVESYLPVQAFHEDVENLILSGISDEAEAV